MFRGRARCGCRPLGVPWTTFPALSREAQERQCAEASAVCRRCRGQTALTRTSPMVWAAHGSTGNSPASRRAPVALPPTSVREESKCRGLRRSAVWRVAMPHGSQTDDGRPRPSAPRRVPLRLPVRLAQACAQARPRVGGSSPGTLFSRIDLLEADRTEVSLASCVRETFLIPLDALSETVELGASARDEDGATSSSLPGLPHLASWCLGGCRRLVRRVGTWRL